MYKVFRKRDLPFLHGIIILRRGISKFYWISCPCLKKSEARKATYYDFDFYAKMTLVSMFSGLVLASETIIFVLYVWQHF
jgi:hypothetical protein